MKIDRQNRIEEIQEKFKSGRVYEGEVQADIEFLLSALDETDEKFDALDRKVKALSSHVLELTQEMENIKSDFGENLR